MTVDREGALRAAAALAAVEALVLGASVIIRGHRSATAVVIVMLAKLLFCRGVLARRAGSFLALVLYEGVTVLFALVAPGLALPARAAAALSGLAVLALLGASARLFPSPPVPRP